MTQTPHSRLDSITHVKECVRYILCREGSKIPIKLSDIKKHLEDNFGVSRLAVKNVMIEANELLKKVYGYELLSVEPAQYIVVLNQPCTYSMLSTYHNSHHRKLLVAALAHIFMTGIPISEDEMWEFLLEANLIKEPAEVEKKLFRRTFTRQLYLKYGKGRNDLYFFEWGIRAEKELPKIFLLNKMSEALRVSLQNWPEQYRIATRNAGDDIEME